MDDCSTSAAVLGAAFKDRGFTLALAESCTGGMVAQYITSVAGSSAWFERGFITYSNAAKVEMLSVSKHTLEQFGAVSEQTAAEMALGALKHSHAHIAGSITGIAGPDGGTPEKPVGMVCFAWGKRDFSIKTATQNFKGSRDDIRQQAANFLMASLLSMLE